MGCTLQWPSVILLLEDIFQNEELFNQLLGRRITLRCFCQSVFSHVKPEAGRINLGISSGKVKAATN